jgi:hypothetical protein
MSGTVGVEMEGGGEDALSKMEEVDVSENRCRPLTTRDSVRRLWLCFFRVVAEVSFFLQPFVKAC